MGGIHYKLFTFFSNLFPNMYISSCITCMHVYKFEIKFDLIIIIIHNDNDNYNTIIIIYSCKNKNNNTY